MRDASEFCPRGSQKVDDLLVFPLLCEGKRRIVPVVPGIDIGPLADQQFHCFQVAIRGCKMKRSTGLHAYVDARPLLDEESA